MRPGVIVACAVALAVPARAHADGSPAPIPRIAPVEPAPDDIPPAQAGFQIGGANVLQILGRLHTAGGVFLEVGGFMMPFFGFMGSAGVVIERSVTSRLSVYIGGGFSKAKSAPEYECEPTDPPDCVDTLDAVFVHARIGIGIRITRTGRLGVDFGFWRGQLRKINNGDILEREPFVIPMVGVSWIVW